MMHNTDFSIICPDQRQVWPSLRKVIVDENAFQETIREIQQFRGGVYLRDGMLDRDSLDKEGRHVSALDYESWHLIIRDAAHAIRGTMWIRIHHLREAPLDFRGLQIQPFLDRMHPEMRKLVEEGVRQFVERSVSLYPYFSEVGGWAIQEEARKTVFASVLASSLWSIARIAGGGSGLSIARLQNNCSGILKRLGGMELVAEGTPLFPFYDTHYHSQFEVLGFASDYFSPRLEPTIRDIQKHILSRPVLTR